MNKTLVGQNSKIAIAVFVFKHTLNSLAAQRHCNSAMGMMAPHGCMQPITASVQGSRSGGKTYLYKSITLSFTSITDLSRNGKPKIYPKNWKKPMK